jgi:hypothetical protein
MKYRILEMADGTYFIQKKYFLIWIGASFLNFSSYDDAYSKIERIKENKKQIALSKTIKKIWDV